MPADPDLTLDEIVVKQKRTVVSLPTLFGLLVGIGLFLSAIALSTDRYMMFFSFSSVLMVLGGTLANAFISYQGTYVVRALVEASRIVTHARINERITYAEGRKIIQWGRIVQQGEVLALDRHIKSTEAHDYYLRYGIHLVVDGYKPSAIRELLTNAIHSTYERALRKVEVLRNMAATAPAFGMIGTLVGLIIMLDSLGANADALGPGLGLALLTTLYGVLAARLIFQPAADKTQQREDIARFRNCLMREGFVMLAEERSPRYIQDRINSFLDPNVLHDIEERRKTRGATEQAPA